MALNECGLDSIPISGSCEQDAEVICRGKDIKSLCIVHSENMIMLKTTQLYRASHMPVILLYSQLLSISIITL